jgi:mannose-1-phosphate guanylyltransferase/mannose-6-phosphate isomerase
MAKEDAGTTPTQNTIILPVILAGGTGSRLWPLSRELYPKQLFKLTGGRTLLQDTCSRTRGIAIGCEPIIVVGREHRFMVREQLDELGLGNRARIIVEPEGRNTAPATIVAALDAVSKHEDPFLLVMPADHLIRGNHQFAEAVRKGLAPASEGSLVTFGVKPERPETGYGYIEKGKGYSVSRFVEKPDQPTAQAYLESGDFFWNSGIFLFKVHRLLDLAERLVPDMLAACRSALEGSRAEQGFIYLDEEGFARCSSDSLDYAIMERADNLAMIPVDFDWSDVGSWRTLHQILPKNGGGNVLQGDVIAEDTSRSLVWADSRLVATLGIDNLLVVETPDAVLVAPLERSQEVKRIVSRLKSTQREEYLVHRTAYRPWGSYTVLEEAPRFKIKRISVKPGASLSLQMHYHRSEHWVVVKGTARVTRDDTVFLLRENESTYISPGQRHRLENPGRIPLEMIEVQNGSYLGEDDITRFEDDYGR